MQYSKKFTLKIGDLIEYNYMYNNLENKTGIILDILDDKVMGTMLRILTSSNIELLPVSIILYKKIQYEKTKNR